MPSSDYSTGIITLTTGSAVVTGTGTAWQTSLLTSGYVVAEAAGNLLPILSVDSDTQITAELEWAGATGSYSYVIQRNPDQLQDNAANSRNLAYLLSELRQGTLFKYDAAGTLADRDLFDGRPKGYSYLVFSETEAILYVKATNTSGDWAGPYAYGTGPQGEQGPIGTLNPMGTYNAVTTYAANDNVLYNGSSFVALQATTGNAPPTLPTTENAYWSLLAVKGTDGAGTGDVVGPASAVDNRLVAFDGTTGKLVKDAGVLVSGIATLAALGALPDDSLILTDPADGTKKGRFDVGAVTAGQTRVLALPDKDVDLGEYFRAGNIVGSAYNEFAVYFGGADAIPFDNSAPQSTEGSGIMSISYTPKSATNRLRIRATVQCTTDGLRNAIAALHVGNGTSAARVAYATTPAADYYVNLTLTHDYSLTSTNPVDIVVRAGPGGTGVIYFNGSTSQPLFGGTPACTLTVEEIKP